MGTNQRGRPCGGAGERGERRRRKRRAGPRALTSSSSMLSKKDTPNPCWPCPWLASSSSLESSPPTAPLSGAREGLPREGEEASGAAAACPKPKPTLGVSGWPSGWPAFLAAEAALRMPERRIFFRSPFQASPPSPTRPSALATASAHSSTREADGAPCFSAPGACSPPLALSWGRRVGPRRTIQSQAQRRTRVVSASSDSGWVERHSTSSWARSASKSRTAVASISCSQLTRGRLEAARSSLGASHESGEVTSGQSARRTSSTPRTSSCLGAPAILKVRRRVANSSRTGCQHSRTKGDRSLDSV
mmetsp:Transcript_62884/g.141973  ORF Transcript_62884/g.141973 Transcript_62884/m.141973 type:complete len:305 (+) Transcript_62884:418-1332(+)